MPKEISRLIKLIAKGVKNIKVDNKSGNVVAALTPGDANQILATTSSGKVIRTHRFNKADCSS